MQTISCKTAPSPTNEELAEAYQSGDKSAMGLLLARNAGLIYNLSRPFLGQLAREMEHDDVLQIARSAFVKSVRQFESGRNFRLTTYAGKSIQFALVNTLSRLRRWRQSLPSSGGRAYRKTQFGTWKEVLPMRGCRHSTFISDSDDEFDVVSRGEYNAGFDSRAELDELTCMLRRLSATFRGRKSQVLQGLLDGQRCSEIAIRIGISKEAVRQHRDGIIESMADAFGVETSLSPTAAPREKLSPASLKMRREWARQQDARRVPAKCPRCEGLATQRHGADRTGRQRHKCTQCLITFFEAKASPGGVPNGVRLSLPECATICRMASSGMSIRKVSEATGVCRESVSRVLKLMGVTPPTRKRLSPRATKEDGE